MTNLIPSRGRNKNLTPAGFGNIFNMIDDFFTDDFPVRRSLSHDTFKVDIKEEVKAYVVEAELPGVKKEEISISVDDGILKIAVNHEESTEEQKSNYIHKERRYCSMERRLSLGNADEEGIKASLDQGLLTISIPKKDRQDNTRRIEIE